MSETSPPVEAGQWWESRTGRVIRQVRTLEVGERSVYVVGHKRSTIRLDSFLRRYRYVGPVKDGYT